MILNLSFDFDGKTCCIDSKSDFRNLGTCRICIGCKSSFFLRLTIVFFRGFFIMISSLKMFFKTLLSSFSREIKTLDMVSRRDFEVITLSGKGWYENETKNSLCRIKYLLGFILVMYFSALSPEAKAANSCVIQGTTSTSPTLQRISSVGNGNTIWTGNFVTTFNCSMDGSSTFSWNLNCITGGIDIGMSGVACYALGNGTFTSLSHTAASACTAVTLSDGTYYGLTVSSSTAQTCVFSMSFPSKLVQTSTSISGNSQSWAFGNIWGGGPPYGVYPVITANTATCTLNSSAIVVQLPKVSAKALNAAGTTAGKSPFAINISGCASGTYAALIWFGYTPGIGTNSIQNSNASPASNVEVQLLNSSGASIANQQLITIAPSVTTGASYTGQFYAQYYATGAAGAGGVTGIATFTMSYQ